MVSKKRLPPVDDLSDSETIGLNGQITPPSHPQSDDFKSPEELDSNHAAGEETSSMLKSRKKRKATVSSFALDPKRIWNKDGELAILKGIVDYQNKTGVNYLSDSVALFDTIKNDINVKFSKDQLVRKIRKLKKRYQDNLAKNPCFTKSQDSEIFDLSMKIWGKDKTEGVDGSMDKAKGTKKKVHRAFAEHEAVTNGKPENGEGLAKGDSCENVDKHMENESGEKKSEEDGSAKGEEDKLTNENLNKRMEEEELLALEDALEMTMFENLGKYAQKLMLGKLRTLGAEERKELSDEWKSLLHQEAQLKYKKQLFSVKLAKAVLDD